MGMSTHVVGFKDADQKYITMKRIWVDCEFAKIPIPDEVSEFFNHTRPSGEPGERVEIESSPAVTPWEDESREGFEIEIAKLPKGVKWLRFYNSF
jgi:hypothetical protein